MDTLQLVASVFGGWLPLVPVRPLVQLVAIAVGIVLIVRLNAALTRIDHVAALPRDLRAEVMTLHKQVEDLRARLAETRRYRTKPADPTAALAIYRNLEHRPAPLPAPNRI